MVQLNIAGPLSPARPKDYVTLAGSAGLALALGLVLEQVATPGLVQQLVGLRRR